MASKTNMTPDDAEADLEAAFAMALSDALKADKVASSVLEVARRTIEDHRAQRRWEAEQESLARQAAPGATGEATAQSTAPRIVHGIDLDKLPFPATKRRGVEHPPVKTTEPDDNAKPTTTWDALDQVPFMSPQND
jgi:hypothetical protein